MQMLQIPVKLTKLFVYDKTGVFPKFGGRKNFLGEFFGTQILSTRKKDVQKDLQQKVGSAEKKGRTEHTRMEEGYVEEGENQTELGSEGKEIESDRAEEIESDRAEDVQLKAQNTSQQEQMDFLDIDRKHDIWKEMKEVKTELRRLARIMKRIDIKEHEDLSQ